MSGSPVGRGAADAFFETPHAAVSAALLTPGTELSRREDMERLLYEVRLERLSSRSGSFTARGR